MRLADDGFYGPYPVTKRFTAGVGNDARTWDTPYTRYSYETRSALYDVDVRNSDGDKTYHVNCGFETEPGPIHKAIEVQFGLQRFRRQ